MEDDPLTDILVPLGRVVAALHAAGLPIVLYGGIAVNLRGRRRYTDDIDLAVDVVDEIGYERLLEALRSCGASVREPALARLKRDGMLAASLDGVKIDVLVPAEELTAFVIRGATPDRALGYDVGLARAEDLIVMKLLARRGQDIEDVKGLLVANRDQLDFDRIRRWLPDLDAMKAGATELFDSLKKEFHDPLPPSS